MMRGIRNVIRSATVAIILAAVVPVCTVVAQADRDTLLPDLAPRELEILGNLEITFPSLRRQPLSGFNPPPRIYEIPRGWRPWTGEYKQPSADLPGSSLIQPASPPTTISVGQHPHNGELSLGIGRYLSREVRAQASFDVGSNLVAYGDAFHEGLSKYEPFDDTLGTEAPEQNYDGLAGFTYRAGATSAGVEVSGFFRQLDLYGARADSAPYAVPERDGQGFGGKVWVATGSDSKIPVRLSATYRSNTYETNRSDLERPVSVDGSQLLIEADTKLDVGNRVMNLDGKVWLDSQTGFPDPPESIVNPLPAVPENDVTIYQTGGDFNLRLGGRGSLRLGAEVHGYSVTQRDPQSLGSGQSNKSKFYVAPRVSYVNLIASGAEFYVRNDPIVQVNDQQEMFGANPFLLDGVLSLPELSILNTEAGFVLYRGPVRLAVRSGVTIYENLLYFVSAASPQFGSGFFDARYDNGDILFAGGDVGVTFPGSFSATLTGRWQSAKLGGDGGDVPNYPRFVGGVRASYVFAEDRALLQLDGKFVGERPTGNVRIDDSSVIDEERLNGYVDAAFLASYYFENGIGLFGRVQTMTGSTFERWVGYPVADWVTLGGIRLRW